MGVGVVVVAVRLRARAGSPRAGKARGSSLMRSHRRTGRSTHTRHIVSRGYTVTACLLLREVAHTYIAPAAAAIANSITAIATAACGWL